MGNLATYISSNIETIHFIIGFASSIICLVLGAVLLNVRFCKNIKIESHHRPTRYIAARRALGLAYIIIGVFSMLLLYTFDVREQEGLDFFPLTGLIISISQIILFTVAVLALFNSKLLNSTVVIANIAPIAILLLLYLIFQDYEQVLFSIRFALFFYYMVQLVVYTVAFVIERKKFLLIIEDYFDKGILYDKYRCKGISVVYFSAIGIGTWALASYFFTTLEQDSLFIFCYTIYYIIVAVYYINYSKMSSRIQDVTTPENWKQNENFSREEHMKEQLSLQNKKGKEK